MSTQQIRAQYKNFSSGKNAIPQTRTIEGFQFKDEDPRLLSLASMLIFGPEIVKARTNGKLSPSCNKLLCLMEATYGVNSGPRILYLADKYNVMAGSHALADAQGPLTSTELDTLISTLKDLPTAISSTKKTPSWNDGVTNALLFMYQKDGGEAAATYGNKDIKVYDFWRTRLSVSGQKRAIFHEYAHSVADAKGFNDNPEWLKLGNWKMVKGKMTSVDPHSISGYGHESPTEDFAETMTSYRYSPERLKKLAPEKYAFMKNRVFYGIEYSHENAYCNKGKKPVEKVDVDCPVGTPVNNFLNDGTKILERQK